MPKVLKEKTNIVAKKNVPMKKAAKKSEIKIPSEIDQIKMIAEMIESLEKQCQHHGLETQLAMLKRNFRPSYLQ